MIGALSHDIAVTRAYSGRVVVAALPAQRACRPPCLVVRRVGHAPPRERRPSPAGRSGAWAAGTSGRSSAPGTAHSTQSLPPEHHLWTQGGQYACLSLPSKVCRIAPQAMCEALITSTLLYLLSLPPNHLFTSSNYKHASPN
jgi:hypothetical protein